MSATGLDVFDTTLQKTNTWLKDLMQELGCTERDEAYRAMRAALHALRDRLTAEEVAQFGAQLPMLVRGFYYEGWDPTGKPVKERHKEGFLAQMEAELWGKRGDGPRAGSSRRLYGARTVRQRRGDRGCQARLARRDPRSLAITGSDRCRRLTYGVRQRSGRTAGSPDAPMAWKANGNTGLPLGRPG